MSVAESVPARATRRRHRSTTSGQRGWKWQPGGGSSGLGISPRSERSRGAAERGSRSGIARAAPGCRGGAGAPSTARVGPGSTIRPRYITATRSAMCSTTARSWVMSTIARPSSRCSSASRLRICACTEHVERRDRLVGDEHVGLGGERGGDRRRAGAGRPRARAAATPARRGSRPTASSSSSTRGRGARPACRRARRRAPRARVRADRPARVERARTGPGRPAAACRRISRAAGRPSGDVATVEHDPARRRACRARAAARPSVRLARSRTRRRARAPRPAAPRGRRRRPRAPSRARRGARRDVELLHDALGREQRRQCERRSPLAHARPRLGVLSRPPRGGSSSIEPAGERARRRVGERSHRRARQRAARATKRQPGGGSARSGTPPATTVASAPGACSARRERPRAAPACTGGAARQNTLGPVPTSTSWPAYITADPVADLRDARRGRGVISTIAVPRRARRSRSSAEHLRLDRDVERGRRLVGDQQRRVVGERRRDHDALPHAAREAVRRVARSAAPASGMPTSQQQRDRALREPRGAVTSPVRRDRLAHLAADREAGSSDGHRVLEDHARSASPRSSRSCLAGRPSSSRSSSRIEPVTRAAGGSRPITASAERRLAAARLADEPEDLALGHARGLTSRAPRPAASRRRTDDAQARSRAARSLRPPPRVEPRAQPVAEEAEASTAMRDREAGEDVGPRRLLQHLAAVGEHQPERRVGGWTPRPRNESAASIWSAKPHSTLACTIAGPIEFGSTWPRSTARCEAPRARAASTYGSRARPTRPSRARPARGSAGRSARSRAPAPDAARPGDRDQRDREQHRRQRQQHVERAHQRRVDPAAGSSPATQPERHRHHERAPAHRADRDRERRRGRRTARG